MGNIFRDEQLAARIKKVQERKEVKNPIAGRLVKAFKTEKRRQKK